MSDYLIEEKTKLRNNALKIRLIDTRTKYLKTLYSY